MLLILLPFVGYNCILSILSARVQLRSYFNKIIIIIKLIKYINKKIYKKKIIIIIIIINNKKYNE